MRVASASGNRNVASSARATQRSCWPDHALGLAFEAARIEVQLDGAIGVGVGHRMDVRADVGDDVELLVQLAAQRLGVGLVRMALPARELPVIGQVGALGTQREEVAAVMFDDGRHHDDVHASDRRLSGARGSGAT